MIRPWEKDCPDGSHRHNTMQACKPTRNVGDILLLGVVRARAGHFILIRAGAGSIKRSKDKEKESDLS